MNKGARLLCKLVQHAPAVTPTMPAVTEEEAATLDRAKFHETYRTEKSVVIKGLVRSWPAYNRWEPAQLNCV